MSFSARLSSDVVPLEAGTTASVSVEVDNRGDESDRFELEVEGLDPEWVAVPVPTFPVDASGSASEKVFFKPPRSSESLSGNYPFVAKVRSLTTGEQRSVQGVLQIRTYHHVSVEISPKKGLIAPFRRMNDFTVTVMNLGNTEHRIQLSGSDPEESLAFDFEQDQVTIGPGQQKDISVVVDPANTRFLASGRLYGFVVTGRSMDTPTIAASTQGQLEWRAALSPSTVVFLFFAAVVLAAWLYMTPKPPTLELGVTPSKVNRGETVEIWWKASNANRVTIEVAGRPVYDGNRTEWRTTYTAAQGGALHITGLAQRDGRQSEMQEVDVTVEIPPSAPEPRIERLTLSKTRARVGDSVILTYKFNSAVTRAQLQPLQTDLNLSGDQIQIQLKDKGSHTYTVIAENADGSTVRRSVTVVAEESSAVSVVVFRSDKESVPYPSGLITISWQLSNAVRAEIAPNPTNATGEVDPAKGSFEVFLDKTTTFTLTGYDEKGLKVTETITVEVEDPPPAPPDESFVPPPAVGTTGGGA